MGMGMSVWIMDAYEPHPHLPISPKILPLGLPPILFKPYVSYLSLF